MEIYWEGKTE